MYFCLINKIKNKKKRKEEKKKKYMYLIGLI